MCIIKSWFKGVRHDDEGVTAIEYALLAVLIAVALIAGATALGGNLNSRFNHISQNVGQ